MGRTIQNQVSIYINDALLADVDRLSVNLGKSRASTIKWVLSEFQDGMNMVSDALESIEDEKQVSVASFLKIMSKASSLIGQKQFDLGNDLEHENASND